MKLNLKLKLAEGATEFLTHRSSYEVLTNSWRYLWAKSSELLTLSFSLLEECLHRVLEIGKPILWVKEYVLFTLK